MAKQCESSNKMEIGGFTTGTAGDRAESIGPGPLRTTDCSGLSARHRRRPRQVHRAAAVLGAVGREAAAAYLIERGRKHISLCCRILDWPTLPPNVRRGAPGSRWAAAAHGEGADNLGEARSRSLPRCADRRRCRVVYNDEYALLCSRCSSTPGLGCQTTSPSSAATIAIRRADATVAHDH